MVDTIHMNIEETSLTEPIHACGESLRHVHLCESNGGRLGSGNVAFRSVLAALRAIQYSYSEALKCIGIYRCREEHAPAWSTCDPYASRFSRKDSIDHWGGEGSWTRCCRSVSRTWRKGCCF